MKLKRVLSRMHQPPWPPRPIYTGSKATRPTQKRRKVAVLFMARHESSLNYQYITKWTKQVLDWPIFGTTLQAPKLHTQWNFMPFRQVAFETLSLRVVWFPRAKMKHSAFPHCQTRIVTKKNHLIGIFLILSPRKKRLLYMESSRNTFQMRRKSMKTRVIYNPNRGIFHDTSQYKRKNSRNEVV